MKQSEIMMQSEGNAWFERNRRKLGRVDRVSDIITELGIKPTSVAEIGCANGWRLDRLRTQYSCLVFGVEPSMEAAIEAAGKGIAVYQSTADALPFLDSSFDLVIYAFSLYLTDPIDWLKIAAEGDRILKSDGYLIIHDFAESDPFARDYEHYEDLKSFHYDFAKLWLGHPLYSLFHRNVHADDEMVTVLKKAPVSSIEVRA